MDVSDSQAALDHALSANAHFDANNVHYLGKTEEEKKLRLRSPHCRVLFSNNNNNNNNRRFTRRFHWWPFGCARLSQQPSVSLGRAAQSGDRH